MKHEDIPEIISVQNMAKLLNLSRARFYSLTSTCDISKCFFLPPIYSLDNQRPFYNKAMALLNLEIKRNCTGWNHRLLLFYSPRGTVASSAPKIKKKNSVQQFQQNDDRHSELKEGLKSLGLSDISTTQIDAAMSVCFPSGSNNIDDGEMLRVIFRHFKQQNSEHKQRT